MPPMLLIRPLSALAALVLAVSGCSPAATSTADLAACKSRSSDAIGGPFRLTAHDGSPTTEANFKGRKTLVFFGYTYCPDICPITLFNAGRALADVPEAKRPRTAFISVDPARDTPETISQYIKSNGFPEDIVGLTGTLDELNAVNTAFKTGGFGRDDDGDTAEGYLVRHSAILYLMDENWKLETFFMEDQGPADIAKCLNLLG